MSHPRHVLKATSAGPQAGFSLVELSVVLVVIGVILGMTSIAKDLFQNANQQKAAAFVQSWALAYDAFVAATGRVPGDTAAVPTGRVNGAVNSALCGVELQNALLAVGVPLPSGRAEGSASLYAYQDSRGLPQQLEVCFVHSNWSEPGTSVGTYQVRQRNVMRLAGVTPGLAFQLDNLFDSRVDARFGRFREDSQAANTGTASQPWSSDERAGRGGSSGDEAQSQALVAYLRMTL